MTGPVEMLLRRRASSRSTERTSACRPATGGRPRKTRRTSPASTSASARPATAAAARMPATGSAAMQRRAYDAYCRCTSNIISWHSPRLGYDLGVAVFGHWGPPMLAFPTSHGDEWELRAQRADRRARRFRRRRPRQDLLRRLEQPRLVHEQGRAPVAPQLAPAAVRRVHPRRGRAVHPRALPVPGHPDHDDGRVARRVPRGQYAASAIRTW